MKNTTTLSSFCQGAEQILAVEAAVRKERVDETLAKKITFWKTGMFRVVVMGEIKKGKSSFVNALLGVENLVPVCDDVATSTVYKICYGVKREYRVFFTKESGKPVQTISAEEVAAYGTERGNPGNEKSVEFIQVLCPSPMLKDGLVIIDTPGLGGIVKEHKKITYDYVPKSDAVFVVTESGNSPLGALEMSLIADLKKVTKHIYFVQTKSGTVSEDESKKRRERNLQILTTSAGFRQDEIKYFVVDSALKVAADEDKDCGVLTESGYDKVSAFVNQYIRPNVQRLIIERAIAMIKPRVESLGQIIADREKVFAAKTESERLNLSERIKEAQDQIAVWERDQLPVLQTTFEQGLLDLQQNANQELEKCMPQGEVYDGLVEKINLAANVEELKGIAQSCNEKLPGFFSDVGQKVVLEVKDGIMGKLKDFAAHCGTSCKIEGESITTISRPTIVAKPIGDRLGHFEMTGSKIAVSGLGGGMYGAAIATFVGGAIGSVVPVVGTIVGSQLGVAVGGILMASNRINETVKQNIQVAKQSLIMDISAWMNVNYRNLLTHLNSTFSQIRLKASSEIRAIIRNMQKEMKRDLDTLTSKGKEHLDEVSREQTEFNMLKRRYINAVTLMGVMNNGAANVA